MSELNPYAPPTADPSTPVYRVHGTGHVPVAVHEAIAALNAHLSNPAKVAEDREAYSKVRWRPLFAVLAAVAGVGGGTFAVLTSNDENQVPFFLAFGVAILGGLCALIIAIRAIMEQAVGKRDKPGAPDAALKSYFNALVRRHGFAWACLCPTAREQPVAAPPIAPVIAGPGEFVLRTPNDVGAWSKTFAFPGHGQMHAMKVKKITVLRESDGIAEVEVHAVFQSWPQWANIVSLVLLLLIRLVGIIAYVALYFSLRKTFPARFTKTMIRGSDGLWYVYSAPLFEGPVSPP